MGASILVPDNTTSCGGVLVHEYLLTKHNNKKIDMPNSRMEKVIGVTIHNTDWINVASNTTPAEQYTRATLNGNMKSVRVHYYVDDKVAWQNLPLTLTSWHAADGSGDGNMHTISIECIMSKNYNIKDRTSEDNAARLAAYLLVKYNLDIDHLYTHTHWLNVRDGKKGSTDYLNTLKHPYKYCPAYILPHWSTFKNKVQSYISEFKQNNKTTDTDIKNDTTVIENNNKINNSNNTEKIIWDALHFDTGFTDAGVAALMGNMFAESGLNPINLQDTYNKKLGYTDDGYTRCVDNGSYSNFVGDAAGYGLAQWTYRTRKQALYNFAKHNGDVRSIGDLNMQLEFLIHEIKNNYVGLFNLLRISNDVEICSNAVLVQYERPADMSDAVKNKRFNFSKKYYDKYHGTTDTSATKVVSNTQNIDTIVDEVIQGKWGNGLDRKTKLTEAGYDYTSVQRQVSLKMKAYDVIHGYYGNGLERKYLLGDDYDEVQQYVNKILNKKG